MVCCGAFSITSPLLCPVLLATHVIGTEIGATADPIALMRAGRHREIKLFAGGNEGRPQQAVRLQCQGINWYCLRQETFSLNS